MSETKHTCLCGDIHPTGWLMAPESDAPRDPVVEGLKRAMEAAFHPGRIAGEVLAERRRQFERFGDLHYPDGTGRPEDVAMAKVAKAECKANSPAEDNWRDILREEVYEAFAENDRAALRTELVQVAAVAMAWLEDIDGRTATATREDTDHA